MVVDYCKSADVAELEDGSAPEFDSSSCQATGIVPPFNEYLNVNAPLQIGGLYMDRFDHALYKWQFMPNGRPFDGCIKNVFHNSKVCLIFSLEHRYLKFNLIFIEMRVF